MTELKQISDNILIKQFLTRTLQKEYPKLINEIVDHICEKKLTYNESLYQIKFYIGIYSGVTSLAYKDIVIALYQKYYNELIDEDTLSCDLSILM